MIRGDKLDRSVVDSQANFCQNLAAYKIMLSWDNNMSHKIFGYMFNKLIGK